MNGYYQLVVERLKLAGYTFLRSGKGSHEAWTNGSRIQNLSRNMPSRHMANEIMKQAGLTHRF
jgi:predicted RNA binding protein YcfA (HicA-like mRNA interferase family)